MHLSLEENNVEWIVGEFSNFNFLDFDSYVPMNNQYFCSSEFTGGIKNNAEDKMNKDKDFILGLSNFLIYYPIDYQIIKFLKKYKTGI